MEKVLSMLSSSWWCTHVPRISANKAYKTNCLQEFPIPLALNYYSFMCTCNLWTHIYLQKEGISKHSGKQENYAIGLDRCYWLNLEHGTEHDIDTYGVCMH